MLLVKPNIGLSTPAIFKGMGLTPGQDFPGPDPRGLLSSLKSDGVSNTICVNDLEPPAFAALPELAALKDRLLAEERFEAVFMSGSGSTICCMGSDEAPEWIAGEEGVDSWPCRLITREEGSWYQPVSL